MARDHATIRLDMWADDDFRGLSLEAQHLYIHLLSSPTLSYAGVADWRPARIAGMTGNASAASVRAAADELAAKLFVVYDEETEEVLIRSFLKHDGLLHKPNVAKAMVTAYGKTVSATLRGVIVHELRKLHDRFPEWKAFGVEDVYDLLGKPSVDPSETLPEVVGKGSVKGSDFDPSLLTTNSLLPTTHNSQLATSANAVRDDAKRLCDRLQALIVENGSKPPTITDKWLTEARLLLDKDRRDEGQATRLIEWCQQDSFWKGVILSMPKFRAKYDQMRLDANRQLEQRKSKAQARTENNLNVVAMFAAQEKGALEA